MSVDGLALRRIVEDFRRGLLGRKSSTGMCFAVCYPLQAYLETVGYKTEMIKGIVMTRIGRSEHYWLRCSDGRIIDPTYDQVRAPDGAGRLRVYIGDQPLWYQCFLKEPGI